AIIVMIIAPKVNEQINNLIESFPAFAEKVSEWRPIIIERMDHLPEQIKNALESAIGTIESSAGKISSELVRFLQGIASAVISLVLVPFFFIFMLKDHEKLAPRIYGWFSGGFREWLKKTLSDINKVLKSYIQGQMIISI